MNVAEQKNAARHFVETWKDRGRERADSQPFWLALLRDVYGQAHPEEVISFEDSVMLDHASFIDGYIPATHVLIEQKSRGKDLDAPIRQSDDSLLTPFEQAKRYSTDLPYDDRPRWIVTCNFDEFRIYDMNRPHDPPEIVYLADLENEVHRLQFLVDGNSVHVRREMEISVEAGETVGRIYDALLEQYKDPNNPESQHALNVLCVRLVFCLYAENAGIFGKYGMFGDYLRSHKDSAHDALMKLFRILDEKEEDRDNYLDDDIAAFPYVNGGLFRGDIEIPRITPEIVDTILHTASDGFNWRDISPTIFGAIFESTLNPQTRRQGGMHYTSVENIHKVIDPLFLDGLRADLETAQSWKQEKRRKKELQAFRDKLAALKFLDPACGSGNFLTETYLSLRRLENEAIRAMTHGQIGWAVTNPIEVSITHFFGIEINDFACTVARTALWIAEAQMLQETESILNMEIDYLPLKTAAHIVEGNALRMDWEDVVPKGELNYIMGNPPFVGYSLQTTAQKKDMRDTYVQADGTPYRRAGKIDYVAGWFFKAAQMMESTSIRTAFVATNSITQGDQPAPIWKPLMERFGMHIDFAWRTFRWDSEASEKAHVHVVIIGFSNVSSHRLARMYSDSGMVTASCINANLIPGSCALVEARKAPLCDIPSMVTGNRPADGGNLILEEREYNDFVAQEPSAIPYIRRLVGSKDYIQGKKRWCLWLTDVSPAELRTMPMVMERVEQCRQDRLHAPDPGRRKLAETPWLFRERQNPSSYILVPRHSSEKRRYIPFGFLSDNEICGDSSLMIPNATLYHFGILTSNVHMAWMRMVAGRLKSDFRYSRDIVYNNFPWPDPTSEQKAKVEQTAQAILDARALYPKESPADLYGDKMYLYSELKQAHADNDKAVMAAYGMKPGTEEPEIVARLMQMYEALISADK